MNRKKRAIAIILTLSLIVACLAVPVCATIALNPSSIGIQRAYYNTSMCKRVKVSACGSGRLTVGFTRNGAPYGSKTSSVSGTYKNYYSVYVDDKISTDGYYFGT